MPAVFVSPQKSGLDPLSMNVPGSVCFCLRAIPLIQFRAVSAHKSDFPFNTSFVYRHIGVAINDSDDFHMLVANPVTNEQKNGDGKEG